MAMATLDIFRSTVGAVALVFARHALDEALERVKSRKMFGSPMSNLKLIQAKLGDMSLDIDASALLIYRAVWTKDNSADRITREATMAKLFATEAAPTCYRRSCKKFLVNPVWFPDSLLSNSIGKSVRSGSMKVLLRFKN